MGRISRNVRVPRLFYAASGEAMTEKTAIMRSALLEVIAWLDREPTREGRVFGHGSAAIRKVCEAALEAGRAP